MTMTLYKFGIAHAASTPLDRRVRTDAFGTRSYQVLVPDEMVFSPGLSEEDLLLRSIRNLKRVRQQTLEASVEASLSE